jgi:hypothetical protein
MNSELKGTWKEESVIQNVFLFCYFLEVTERNHENSLASIRAYPKFKTEVFRASTNLFDPLEKKAVGGKGKR